MRKLEAFLAMHSGAANVEVDENSSVLLCMMTWRLSRHWARNSPVRTCLIN